MPAGPGSGRRAPCPGGPARAATWPGCGRSCPATGCAGSTGGSRGRTGELHVTATYSDRDAEVLLLLDSVQDRRPGAGVVAGRRRTGGGRDRGALPAGRRPGRPGRPRQPAAPRPAPQRPQPPRTAPGRTDGRSAAAGPARRPGGDGRGGRAQLARTRWSWCSPRSPTRTRWPRSRRWPGPAGSWSRSTRCRPTCTRTGAATGRRWPPGSGGCDRWPTCGRLRELGVPVVAWGGAGRLDQVLRDVTRLARAARTAR